MATTMSNKQTEDRKQDLLLYAGSLHRLLPEYTVAIAERFADLIDAAGLGEAEESDHTVRAAKAVELAAEAARALRNLNDANGGDYCLEAAAAASDAHALADSAQAYCLTTRGDLSGMFANLAQELAWTAREIAHRAGAEVSDVDDTDLAQLLIDDSFIRSSEPEQTEDDIDDELLDGDLEDVFDRAMGAEVVVEDRPFWEKPNQYLAVITWEDADEEPTSYRVMKAHEIFDRKRPPENVHHPALHRQRP